MKFTDWKSDFNQFYLDIERKSLASKLISLDWKRTTLPEIHALSDDIDRDIFCLKSREYCALLPILLDAISGVYHNVLASHTLSSLIALPEARLQIWKKAPEQQKILDEQSSLNKLLVSAADAMGVKFDPDEHPRHDPLAPYSEQQRAVLREKINELLELSEHHLGHDEHPFSPELEDLASLLSVKIEV